MADITLIFPDQLFLHHPAIAQGRQIYLVEEFLFFKVQPFHKQRLVLLRAAMRSFAERLIKEKRQVVYIPSKELGQRGDLFKQLAKRGIKSIHLAEFADDWLKQDLMQAAQKYGWKIYFYASPGYICTENEISAFFKGKDHFSMAQFYAYQRKRLNILMDDQKPVGGKYSFDTENRKKIPKGLVVPPAFIPEKNQTVQLVIEEVEAEFEEAVGQADPFLYPTTHEQARQALHQFLNSKITLFGDYQDAIQVGDSFLYHSVLSPLINIGLLTPMEVVQAALDHAKKHLVPMNCLEGFIRQIIGWREFVRASYLLKGSRQRCLNFFHHHHKLPKSFWNGTVGLLPIDTTIRSILKSGYCNHIERLMVLGNFLLLTETDPNAVYEWFMAFFVDAYDWVMVPNIYGMSQYADGGMIVTKPYISASNYLLKMSNYGKGDWTEVWDGLFWRFLHIHRALFENNYRTKTLLQLLVKNEDTIAPKMRKAESWLKDYRHNC